ncbi:MAG: DUF6491 family protein [Gammaproteobacteria bacterium]|nr:DUF6491 family protein [Gammaproteobacteria bacterium]MDH5619322.1 DUF6491 family protein [Gammaproteobacteria bacterium]
MKVVGNALFVACTAAVLCVGCAVSPEAENRRAAVEADIADILSMQLDPAELGEPKRCLSDSDYRNFRALDDRRILFEGRRGKLWINTLRTRCPDLRYGDILVVRTFSGRRLCDADSFEVADWFDWPWYRRWPWRWGGSWGVGMHCTLGQFQPVTEAQVQAIEEVLESR